MKKTIIFFLFFILLINLVSADWLDDGSCQLNTNCVLTIQYINLTTAQGISNGNCTINIYNQNSTALLFNTSMLNLTSGFYNYSINMNETGRFPTFVNCDFLGDVDRSDETFIVSDPNYNEWLYLLLLIIPISLFLIGRKEGIAYTMLGGFVLITYGIAVFMGLFPRLPDSFLTEGLAVILFGIGFYLILDSSIKYVKEVE